MQYLQYIHYTLGLGPRVTFVTVYTISTTTSNSNHEYNFMKTIKYMIIFMENA